MYVQEIKVQKSYEYLQAENTACRFYNSRLHLIVSVCGFIITLHNDVYIYKLSVYMNSIYLGCVSFHGENIMSLSVTEWFKIEPFYIIIPFNIKFVFNVTKSYCCVCTDVLLLHRVDLETRLTLFSDNPRLFFNMFKMHNLNAAMGWFV